MDSKNRLIDSDDEIGNDDPCYPDDDIKIIQKDDKCSSSASPSTQQTPYTTHDLENISEILKKSVQSSGNQITVNFVFL